jgi:hypothetical protein
MLELGCFRERKCLIVIEFSGLDPFMQFWAKRLSHVFELRGEVISDLSETPFSAKVPVMCDLFFFQIHTNIAEHPGISISFSFSLDRHSELLFSRRFRSMPYRTWGRRRCIAEKIWRFGISKNRCLGGTLIFKLEGV